MQNTFETSRKYLLTLKERSGMSWAELSAATQLPDSTIRKIFSGDTSDPRLETISLIVTAMGGSLDDMLTGQPLQDSKPPDAESSVDPSDSQSEALCVVPMKDASLKSKCPPSAISVLLNGISCCCL